MKEKFSWVQYGWLSGKKAEMHTGQFRNSYSIFLLAENLNCTPAIHFFFFFFWLAHHAKLINTNMSPPADRRMMEPQVRSYRKISEPRRDRYCLLVTFSSVSHFFKRLFLSNSFTPVELKMGPAVSQSVFRSINGKLAPFNKNWLMVCLMIISR